MGDYANYGRDLFKAAGFVYIAISVIAIGLALWLPKGKVAKAIAAGIVIALASILPIQGLQEIRAQQARADEFKKRYDKAKALFDEKCKTAGEKIYRTVEGVEGVQLLQLRENSTGEGQMDTNPLRQLSGESLIASYLLYEVDTEQAHRALIQNDKISKKLGYRYVVANDPKDKRLSQYVLNGTKLVRKTENFQMSKYGVVINEPIISGEREHWIGKSVIQVIDIQTKEVLAESTKYVMDHGLGSRGGHRTPWLFAKACNSQYRYPYESDRLFVDQVLKPVQAK